MDLKKLLGLRPKETTAAGLAATRESLEREVSDLGGRIAEMQRTRGERLLDGEPAAVERAEADLKVAEDERARLAAMLDVVRHREVAAKQREDREAVQQLQDVADAKLAAFVTWYSEEYPKHARAIARGLMLEGDVIAAQRAAKQAAELHGVPVEKATVEPKIAVLPGLSYAYPTVGSLVMLPPEGAPEGTAAAPIWPPARHSLSGA